MSTKLPEQPSSEEIDLGQLLKLIGNAFNRFFRFIGSILNALFLAFVWLVFFIRRHVIKIVVATILGFGLGYVKQKTSDPVYESTIVVKQNYNTGENLNSLIGRYNDLISEKDSIALSAILRITPKEANSIVRLNLGSILDNNQKLRLYNNYTKEIDSMIALNLDFENYLDNSNDYDYQYQKITLKARTKTVFEKVFHAIVENAQSSAYFKNEQKKDLNELIRREKAIIESLKESDSLQKVYQLVLQKSVENVPGSQTSVTIDNKEDKSITKEFELFNKDLDLRRELVEIERTKENLEQIIEIVSTDQYIGTLDNRKKIFGISLGLGPFYGVTMAFLVFIVLLALEFFRYLERFRNKV